MFGALSILVCRVFVLRRINFESCLAADTTIVIDLVNGLTIEWKQRACGRFCRGATSHCSFVCFSEVILTVGVGWGATTARAAGPAGGCGGWARRGLPSAWHLGAACGRDRMPSLAMLPCSHHRVVRGAVKLERNAVGYSEQLLIGSP